MASLTWQTYYEPLQVQEDFQSHSPYSESKICNKNNNHCSLKCNQESLIFDQ